MTVEHRGPTAIVRAVGEIDIATMGAFRSVLEELMVVGHVRLVVDLSGVTFMDSTGLGVLIGVRRKIGVFRGELALVADQPFLVRLLEITALDRVFTRFASVEDAFASGRFRDVAAG